MAQFGIAQRLQGRDLLALGGHLARQHHVEQECRHAEENGGENRGHGFLLLISWLRMRCEFWSSRP